MAGYQELVKNLNNVRRYMRDFWLYGFKQRNDFRVKSSRSYDDARRRCDAWLGETLRWRQDGGRRTVFLSEASESLKENPLYPAWTGKSFTDNDITLHFFLLDLLKDTPSLSAEGATEALMNVYGLDFEVQTVRRKLRAYARIGLLKEDTVRRKKVYRLYDDGPLLQALKAPGWSEAIGFFAETAPLTSIGRALRNRLGTAPAPCRYLDLRIGHILDDDVLYTLLQAIDTGRRVSLNRYDGISTPDFLPLRILEDGLLGRLYIYGRSLHDDRFTIVRLDDIEDVRVGALFHPPTWELAVWLAPLSVMVLPESVTPAPLEYLSMELRIDPVKESGLLLRLEREKGNGRITALGPGHYRYETRLPRIRSLFTWLRSFTGHITAISGSNPDAIAELKADWLETAQRYKEDTHEPV